MTPAALRALLDRRNDANAAAPALSAGRLPAIAWNDLMSTMRALAAGDFPPRMDCCNFLGAAGLAEERKLRWRLTADGEDLLAALRKAAA